MSLIAYYLAFMIAGDFAAYFLGLMVEYQWGSYASLIVFLAMLDIVSAFRNIHATAGQAGPE